MELCCEVSFTDHCICVCEQLETVTKSKGSPRAFWFQLWLSAVSLVTMSPLSNIVESVGHGAHCTEEPK